MKKSTIWLLTILMAITFGGLLYIEIMYTRNMITMRNEQFGDGVRQALHRVAFTLDKDEAEYLYSTRDIKESTIISAEKDQLPTASEGTSYVITDGQGGISGVVQFFTPTDDDPDNSKARQAEVLKSMLVLNNIDGNRHPAERADSTVTSNYIRNELASVGIDIPFEFALTNDKGIPYYATKGFPSTVKSSENNSMFEQPVFKFTSRSDNKLMLKVYFPSKRKYILQSIDFLIPALIFTVVLLIVFVVTIILAFRQKKLNEMKTDFINNMTHEFKTPISTISLAAQMLNDDSVRKSPGMLQHISSVINDETKRLRFQVEKVLQLSLFDRKDATVRLQDVDANVAINNIINTFKIKVERYGGTLTADLDANDAIVTVDEMHFTNVIYNLLDNAVKYRKEDTPLSLHISTDDIPGERLRIIVEDNGIGIRKEDVKKVFEKFYRVSTGNKHDVKGFGLGLAYVKKMVNVLGGTIKVESEHGKGTKFIIILPLTQN